jgi:hypothetical protein
MTWTIEVGVSLSTTNASNCNSYLQQRGWSFDRALDFMKANHVTFINDNVGRVPSDQMPKLQQLARLAGYRFVLCEVSHLGRVAPGETLAVNMKWSNVGVGKLYRQSVLTLYLLDAKGAIVFHQIQKDVDPTRWLPGDVGVAGSLDVPGTVRAGQYTLGVAIVDPTTEKPALHLDIDAPHADRLYRLTGVSVESRDTP